MTSYHVRRVGACSLWVKSMSACESAAAALGLPDITAEDDRQTSGVSYDPPGAITRTAG